MHSHTASPCQPVAAQQTHRCDNTQSTEHARAWSAMASKERCSCHGAQHVCKLFPKLNWRLCQQQMARQSYCSCIKMKKNTTKEYNQMHADGHGSTNCGELAPHCPHHVTQHAATAHQPGYVYTNEMSCAALSATSIKHVFWFLVSVHRISRTTATNPAKGARCRKQLKPRLRPRIGCAQVRLHTEHWPWPPWR